MTKKVFTDTVVGGKVQGLGEFLHRLNGQKITITLEPYKKKRSGAQNRYYWSVVIGTVRQFINDYGNDFSPDDVHEYLMEHVGGYTQIVPMMYKGKATDKMLTRRKSSTKLTTKEWDEYMQKIYVWASERNIYIPEPNEEI